MKVSPAIAVMKIGYNTNGLAFHDPVEAIHLLADTGYRAITITIDHDWIDPNDANHQVKLQRFKHLFGVNGFTTVIDSGARFLLDPIEKYAPSLLESAPERIGMRISFLKHCIDVAAELDSECVTLTSGFKPIDLSFNVALDRLVKNLSPVIDYAIDRNVELGFKPEPGMLIDSTGRFDRLIHLLGSDSLKMAMDISHLFCLSEVPIANYIEKWHSHLVNICVSDMTAGVHEHLELGRGQIYFPPVIESLLEFGYDKSIHVELSRLSHDAAKVVQRSFDFLQPIIEDARSGRI